MHAQNWIGLLVDGRRQYLIGHFWSLAIEEQFYLIWPLIVYKNSTKRIVQVAVCGTLFSVALRFTLLALHVDSEAVYRNTFTRMDALLIGTALACLLRDPSCRAAIRPYAKWMWILPLLSLAIVRAANPTFGTHARGVPCPKVPLAA